MIDRRIFIGTAAASALTLPGRANAQRAQQMPRVALVFATAPVTEMAGTDPIDPLARAFVHGLRDLGWDDRRNIVIERRSAEGRIERLASALGLKLTAVEVGRPDEYAEAFAAMERDRPDALFVVNNIVNYTYFQRITGWALKHRLPTMHELHELREPVDAGGLMSDGPNRAAQLRRAAAFVDKILKGAKPADLPFEQPTKFELVVNLKTAKAIGLSVPQALLLQADEVIE